MAESAANPESSAAVAAYRRMLPVALRRVLASRYAPQTRAKAKRQLAALAETRRRARVQGALLSERLRALSQAPDRTVVLAAGRARIALVDPQLTPVRARRAGLQSVTGALAEAGVDHFCLRGRERGRSVVAVADDDRGKACAALRELCASEPGYVTAPGRPAGRHLAPADDPRIWRRIAESSGRGLRLTWFRTEPTGRLILAERYGCEVQFWPGADGQLLAPRPNGVTAAVDAAAPPVTVEDATSWGYGPVRVRTRAEFAHPLPQDIAFPIDAVYTWVDGDDPAWLRRRAAYAGQTGPAYHDEAANPARYADHDELRYSLRSLAAHAPWIRRVYLVTDDQVPPWLDTTHPGLCVISHRDIFDDSRALPTFNSHAIESRLHHIDGLAEHFLYFNDDVFLGRETVPQDFFLAGGLTKFFPSPALVPFGPPDPDDTPVSAAAKNNRLLIERCFGTTPVHKFKHTPHPLRRSVLTEIEARFRAEHRATGGHRFRSQDDIAVASSLHHYYAFHTGRATPARIRYAYLDLSEPNVERRLWQLLATRDRTAFCVNDTVSQAADSQGQTVLLRPFLQAYFPVPSPYER
ncbi:stealth family protein [Streptomyces coryli]|uniref:stealth family protein n=1 Tax=Streptomyces coryli TaxID=1128680 RepID=UPI0030B8B4F9